jgi:hypothetical protein
MRPSRAKKPRVEGLRLPKRFSIEYARTGLCYSKHEPSQSRFGGEVDEYTTKRWYDDPKHPMVVNLSLTKFSGIGMHFYVEIATSPNSLWSEKLQCWGRPWRDPDRCQYWSEKFNTEAEAQAFIKTTLLTGFKKGPVVVFVKMHQNAQTVPWFYRDGD